MLTQRCGSGPEHTLEDRLELLDRLHRQRLLGYVAKTNVGNHVSAEDIVQETFTRAWQYLGAHEDADPENLRPWLYTVARRLVIDAHRARKARPAEVAMDDAGAGPAADDVIGNLLHAEELRTALLALSPEHRYVMVELYIRDRPADEIAARLNVPIGTVRSRSYYAKRALRGLLAD
ncbi:sigma-70 family RNA polymerase sigma factor [Catenulispora sp. NF23]|uniref:Sigma-70 family RNA polymerase sigma factor n=1 Tax=Catenulispora pinistramenti TaxID=2705254 RepID=A0ABS5KQ70_9ACTN|nr:sigma-70 family RNA polymerase sigma factor [Catenulispora pinistramenti]MBS2536872.1 sigma-70 family RNA polymerase sigma factor [Catenulispora pinistramenti]MBS2548179.1 sigma-70 family RNA polymerase sigma factor [Catenulispora pinistramenti]